jgi:pilus assembly protein Flp/PilA
MQKHSQTEDDAPNLQPPRRDERGASLVEYALLIALIAMVCVAAVTYFGTETGDTYSRVSSSVRAV